jgi:hypothetical protein
MGVPGGRLDLLRSWVLARQNEVRDLEPDHMVRVE